MTSRPPFPTRPGERTRSTSPCGPHEGRRGREPPPSWAPRLTGAGLEAVHWSEVGELNAPDHEIMAWARERGYVVFTHDLDFGALLAMTRATGPSVIQLRSRDVLPAVIGDVVARVLAEHAGSLERGAILSLDQSATRVRLLPLMPQ